MKFTRRALIFTVALLLAAMLLNGCAEHSPETPAAPESTEAPSVDSGAASDDPAEPPKQEGRLPEGEADASIVAGNGLELSRYNAVSEREYRLAAAWFEENGYELYCERETENTLSATYVKGDAYGTLFYRDVLEQLFLGFSETGGESLPTRDTDHTRVCETTVTQPGLSGEGMCEIIRIADGSFLVIDSGTASAGDEIYAELCRLNGSEENIRISAWLLTHSHSDHYGGFRKFLEKHRNRVTVDYVLYAPITRSVIDTMDSYNVSWNTIDYYFNVTLPYTMQLLPGAKLCAVHAGQTFRFADVELQILFSPEYLYVDEIPVDYNNSSVVSRVVGDGGAAIFM